MKYLTRYIKNLSAEENMPILPFEVIDATEFPMEITKLPNGSLVEMIEHLFTLPPSKVIRCAVDGSLIHIAQHLRNAATRKRKKISIAVRGQYIYIGRG